MTFLPGSRELKQLKSRWEALHDEENLPSTIRTATLAGSSGGRRRSRWRRRGSGRGRLPSTATYGEHCHDGGNDHERSADQGP